MAFFDVKPFNYETVFNNNVIYQDENEKSLAVIVPIFLNQQNLCSASKEIILGNQINKLEPKTEILKEWVLHRISQAFSKIRETFSASEVEIKWTFKGHGSRVGTIIQNAPTGGELVFGYDVVDLASIISTFRQNVRNACLSKFWNSELKVNNIWESINLCSCQAADSITIYNCLYEEGNKLLKMNYDLSNLIEERNSVRQEETDKKNELDQKIAILKKAKEDLSKEYGENEISNLYTLKRKEIGDDNSTLVKTIIAIKRDEFLKKAKGALGSGYTISRNSSFHKTIDGKKIKLQEPRFMYRVCKYPEDGWMQISSGFFHKDEFTGQKVVYDFK